jgi:hypothetical protein
LFIIFSAASLRPTQKFIANAENLSTHWLQIDDATMSTHKNYLNTFNEQKFLRAKFCHFSSVFIMLIDICSLIWQRKLIFLMREIYHVFVG